MQNWKNTINEKSFYFKVNGRETENGLMTKNKNLALRNWLY
jgi:hypothetical protein